MYRILSEAFAVVTFVVFFCHLVGMDMVTPLAIVQKAHPGLGAVYLKKFSKHDAFRKPQFKC